MIAPAIVPNACYFCDQAFGHCCCNFTTTEAFVVDGTKYKPSVNRAMRAYVDPRAYWGDVYLEWVARGNWPTQARPGRKSPGPLETLRGEILAARPAPATPPSRLPEMNADQLLERLRSALRNR